MSEHRLQIVTITSSTRDGRFGPVVSRWFNGRAALRDDIEVDHVDLLAAALPATLIRLLDNATQAYLERIGRADAFVVVTPEYNHGYPASLKQAIDMAHGEWRAKPVGFVSYGGLSGGLRAVEQLRQVFAEVHATTLRETVSFHNFWERFDEHGELRNPDGANQAATVMLDQLVWWGRALRDARTKDRERDAAA